VVTHNFLIGWLVRQAMDAPRWRWLSLNHCNAALTVIRYAPGRPSSVLVYNDMQTSAGRPAMDRIPCRATHLSIQRRSEQALARSYSSSVVSGACGY
jgi:hypothetical protein